MLNSCFVMGRLVKDPEIKNFQSGAAVSTITIACNRDIENGKTDFITVKAWGKTGEFIAKYLTKGRLVIVNGRMESDKWTTSNGENRTSWYILATSVNFADSKPKSADSEEPEGFANPTPDEEDAELPF